MKVYMFFANHTEVIEGILNDKIFRRNVSDYAYGDLYTLYAFTNKKKYRDSFFKLRKKEYFFMTEREMSRGDYEQFVKDNYHCKLDKYVYENKETKIELITTEYEFDESRHFWIDYISEHLEDIFSFIPYNLMETLKDKYRDALYAIGLNSLLLVADDELAHYLEDMYESFDDDYVLTVPAETHSEILGRKVTASVSIAGKTLNSFIHIFKEILNEV